MDLPFHDLLPQKPNEHEPEQAESIHCHFCGEVVLPFLRQGYLHQTRNDSLRVFSFWPLGP